MSEHTCTTENPIPIEIADKVEELGQWWTHEDVEEIGETETKVFFKCNSCGHVITIELDD
jgi:hypothetical protein